MALLKRYNSVKASSILESVIALSIISVCLYIAIMVFSTVFTPKTSPKFYNTQNKINELLYLTQLRSDSLDYENLENNLILEEENITSGLKKIEVRYQDSLEIQYNKSFYILND